MVEQQHARAALARDAGAEQPGGAGADDDGIEGLHARDYRDRAALGVARPGRDAAAPTFLECRRRASSSRATAPRARSRLSPSRLPSMIPAPSAGDARRVIARAAFGTRVLFFVFGAIAASWGVHVPSVKAHFAVGEQALAMAMLAGAVGALLALSQAGRLVARHGARPMALLGGLVAAASLAVLLCLHSYVALLALMLLFGAAGSLLDVSINAEATELEHRIGRPVMSGFHAMFSLGGMAGALIGGALQRTGLAPPLQLLASGAIAALAVAWGGSGMLPVQRIDLPARRWRLPAGALLLVGALAAIGFVAEGAMYDWSVLYLRQGLGAEPAIASLAYACFSATMAAARLVGDRVRARLDAVRLLRWSATIGAGGMALALLTHAPAVALLGFACVGLGFANVVPVLFGAASRVPGVTPAEGIAAVSSIGYAGIMVGPPLIGLLAQRHSLSIALWTVVLASLLLGAGARCALAAPVKAAAH
jgi:fucose permease